MTDNEAIKHLQSYAEVVDNMIKYCKDFEPKADITGYLEKKTVFAMAISALKEVQKYSEIGTVEECKELASMVTTEKKNVLGKIVDEWNEYIEIGTVEECKKAVKEEDALKFYYCESENDYYIGKRVGNFYYARYGEKGFEWFMSRYLPWGEHIVKPNTLWKEYTYPSEPKEIPFFEWLQGFAKKYCGGTVEECREAVEKQKPKKTSDIEYDYSYFVCPNCGEWICVTDDFESHKYCLNCGQAILWENLEEEQEKNNETYRC